MDINSVYVTNLVDYSSYLADIVQYLKLIFYLLVVLIALNIIKGA